MNTDEGFFDQLRRQHSPMIKPKQNAESDGKPVTQDDHDVENETGAVRPASQLQSIENRESDIDSLTGDHQNSVVTNESGMPPEARRALVNLLRQGVILSAQKSKLFDSVCRYQIDIRRHLSNMYLELILDEKSGVAFVASIDEEDVANSTYSPGSASEEGLVSLISRRTLSLFDTLLLLVLRKHYQERETSGEQRIIIDVERVESNLTPFLPLTNSSKSDRKKLNAALQKMIEKRLLSSIRGSDDRYEISPIIRYVVNAEFLESMLCEYQRLSNEAGICTQNDFETDTAFSGNTELSESVEQEVQ